jgi:hypothetical protein
MLGAPPEIARSGTTPDGRRARPLKETTATQIEAISGEEQRHEQADSTKHYNRLESLDFNMISRNAR